MTLLALGALALLGLALAVRGWGVLRWRRLTRALVARLHATRIAAPLCYSEADIAGLPPPVQRYFRQVLPDGAPMVDAVELRHRGSFNTAEAGQAWKPFTSCQWVVTGQPGFVWDGRVCLAPAIPAYVHDAYVAGEGVLHPTLAGVLSLADLHGGGAIAAGELMRYLAEAPWYPTALLPGNGVRWTAIGAQSARATLVDGGTQVSLVFTFGADGLIASVWADGRGRTVGGKVLATPWEGRWTAYRREAGMLIPTEGEVAWITPEGRLPYWRGRVESVSYERRAPPSAARS